MAGALRLLIVACVVLTKADEDLKDFDFENDPDEVMIAQESRHYQTIVKPPVQIIKPTGVTNSHRPQYNLDSFETGDFEEIFEMKPTTNLVKNYKSSNHIRAKENMVKEAIIKAIERKDHVGKFAQILPIIRAMSPSQRIALASLVASQVTTPPGRAPLSLGQVRSLFSNTDNTTEQMLPILLDMANMVRKATRPGKETREVRYPQILRRYKENPDTHGQAHKTSGDMKYKTQVHIQGNIRNISNKQANIDDKLTALRRSYTEDDLDDLDDDPFDIGVQAAPLVRPRITLRNITFTNNKTNAISNKINSDKNLTRTSSTTESEATSPMTRKPGNQSRTENNNNNSLDLMADSTNQTLAQDLPVAEKLRALNRYIDRKGSLIRRGTYPPKPYTQSVTRRTTAEPTVGPISRRRPAPARKLPVPTADQSKCELFTNTLCLHAEDYPTEAIVQSIRRNKAAAGALLADYKDPGDGAVDGVSADQEEKYTADHYLVSNRRGDTANRDFAGAGEAGFMCPSTVKYARPQRARATSGQWKYIVNTGEHTQTLRLEKCLKPKDSCTYLTDNFKSKCVQVYNYHRLLTWDQQNGLHMDIFKVPTCCSCHIEGYSVNFPPVGHRIHETSSEHFPGEDLSSEHGNHAFEAVQSTIQRPISKIPPFSISKPESFPPFADNNQNSIPTVTFNKVKHTEPDDSISQSNPMDSYGNTYFPDSFNQASSVRNVRRPSAVKSPASNLDSVTLPSYLEPPTLSASSSFTYINEPPGKFKTSSQFKRGAFRPNRRPIRKKISGPEDLISSGSSAIEALTGSNLGSVENINDFIDEPQIGQAISINPTVRATIGPKLHSVTEQTSTVKSQEQRVRNENFTSNDKRINYNYHPIIDFFGENEKDLEDSSIDREDIEASFVPSVESEWKPINNPPPRSTLSSNSLSRKKQIKLN